MRMSPATIRRLEPTITFGKDGSVRVENPRGVCCECGGKARAGEQTCGAAACRKAVEATRKGIR